MKKLIFLVFLVLSSCDSTTDSFYDERRVMINQIVAFNGFKKSFKPDAREISHYFEDLYKLYLLDEESFASTIKFLQEDGAQLNTQMFNLENIIKSQDYELVKTPLDRTNSFVRLLVNKKINSQFHIKTENIKHLLNAESYQKSCNTFRDKFKQIYR